MPGDAARPGPGWAVALALVVSLMPAAVVAQASTSGQAGCRSDNRIVPHGTRIGVLLCQNGVWVRTQG